MDHTPEVDWQSLPSGLMGPVDVWLSQCRKYIAVGKLTEQDVIEITTKKRWINDDDDPLPLHSVNAYSRLSCARDPLRFSLTFSDNPPGSPRWEVGAFEYVKKYEAVFSQRISEERT